MVSKPILYYFHERIWGNVKWGRIQGDVNPTLNNISSSFNSMSESIISLCAMYIIDRNTNCRDCESSFGASNDEK